jgi:hypothetical protein
MATSSSYTKKTRRIYWWLVAISILLLTLPIGIYVGLALFSGGVLVYQKLALVGSVFVAMLVSTFNLIRHSGLKSPLWIVILGLYFAISQHLLPLMLALALTSIIQDFVVEPMLKKYKIKLEASKAIDDRGL